MNKITVRLSPVEVMQGKQLGKLRNDEAEQSGRVPRYGFIGNPVEIHQQGVLGEIAACKALKIYYEPTLNTFKTRADVADFLEIRTRSRSDYDLLVRPDDDSDRIYVLVTGKGSEYVVHGWIGGTSAKQEKWLQDYGGRPPAYFVPQDALRDPSQLMRLLHTTWIGET